jgi:hypothetical protein
VKHKLRPDRIFNNPGTTSIRGNQPATGPTLVTIGPQSTVTGVAREPSSHPRSGAHSPAIDRLHCRRMAAKRVSWLRLSGLLVLIGMAPAAWGAALDPAGQSAVHLLQQSVQAHRDGTHNQLLRALRHLRDPLLKPFFEQLATAQQPAIRIHGLLGLAELSRNGKLDLARVAEIAEPVVQAEVITAAMDSQLLTLADARQVLDWQNLDLSVKVLVATRLIEAGDFRDAAMLREAAHADTAGRRGLAGLLLHQLGDPAGTAILHELDRARDAQREVVRSMLLQTAARHGFTRTADWAHAVATDPDADPRVAMLGLRTAMRLGDTRATALWRQRFGSSTDVAERVRLALLALRLSPWLQPALFEPMIGSEDEMIAAMGRAGRAIASADPGLSDHVVPLLLMHHPLVNEWALEYAREDATPDDAQLILFGIIRAYGEGPEKTRVQRLDNLIEASMTLFDEHTAVAVQLLTPMLNDPRTERLMRQGLLLGLLRSRIDVAPVVRDLPTFADADTQSLAVLLRARGGGALSPQDLADLRLIVRGGARLQDTLRIQAGWLYLVRTGQADAALRTLRP